MAIPKVTGGSQSASGRMCGQTVPMMAPKFNTTQPDRKGFKAQGSLVGHVAAVPGMGTPATKTLNNAPFKRPADRPAPGGLAFYARRDYQPKKAI